MKPGDKYYDGKVESTGRTIEEIEKDIKKEEERIKTITRMEEMDFYREGRKIYGELYKPAGDGPFPGVIFAHGYGGSHKDVADYAQAFADSGIAAYIFDFIGGGTQIKSDGKMTEMSVLTEAADFNDVFDGIRELSCIDKPRLFVGGASQGGFVATYIAAKRNPDISGLIALYPAYVLQDDAQKRTSDGKDIPETVHIMGRTVGRKYYEDALSFDIYDVMKDVEKPALLIHGTADEIVPIACSERAVQTLPSAKLIKIDGAGHGFSGNDRKYAAQLAIDFVKGKHYGR